MTLAWLTLWPLLPFAAGWLPGRGALWAGAAAGGAGWLAQGLFGGADPAPWAAAGAAWLAASLYSLFHGRDDARRREETAARAAAAADQVEALEKRHGALRAELDRLEKEDARAFQAYSLAKSLTESVSWNGLMSRFTQVLQKVTGSSEFLLYLTSDAGRLELQVQNGAWSNDELQRSLAEDPARHARLARPHPQWVPHGKDTFLQVPLWESGRDAERPELLGMVWVRWADDSHPPLAEIEEIFESLLVGFQKAKLFARMESLSRLDGLTGVMRRQVFLDHAETEWNRARQFKTTFGLMLVDVDHFKRINDTLGHPAGDAVLARLGEILQKSVYETDHVGRYGGEEFAVLFSRAEPEGVRRKAESMRARVAAEPIAAGLENVTVTISLGIAHFPRDGKTVKEVLEAADRALYAAKKGGRNRVVDIGDVR